MKRSKFGEKSLQLDYIVTFFLEGKNITISLALIFLVVQILIHNVHLHNTYETGLLLNLMFSVHQV